MTRKKGPPYEYIYDTPANHVTVPPTPIFPQVPPATEGKALGFQHPPAIPPSLGWWRWGWGSPGGPSLLLDGAWYLCSVTSNMPQLPSSVMRGHACQLGYWMYCFHPDPHWEPCYLPTAAISQALRNNATCSQREGARQRELERERRREERTG